MHDGVWLEFQQRFGYALAIGDVGLQELTTIAALHLCQRLQIAGIGQLVQVEDAVRGVVDEVTDQCRADESGSAGDGNYHRNFLYSQRARSAPDTAFHYIFIARKITYKKNRQE